MHRRSLPTILVIAVAALLSAAMSLAGMTGGSGTPAATGASASAHHGASELQRTYRVVRRCRLVPVKRAGKVVRRRGKVVKRRVCKRVRVPVRVRTTPATPTTPTAPSTVTTAPGTTTSGTTTAPAQPELVVRQFIEAGQLRLTLGVASVPAGTYTVRRKSEGTIQHTLDVRPSGAGVATASFPPLANGEDAQTVVLTAGTWTFRCTVPGHGVMTADLTVTP
ncbi:MAG: hypothetical protein IT200_12505 [Thermoleophilia bacterium]|nr:hypothetical protein [Thermoleophilia bacterium]